MAAPLFFACSNALSQSSPFDIVGLTLGLTEEEALFVASILEADTKKRREGASQVPRL